MTLEPDDFRGERIDRKYLHEWISALGLAEEWQRVDRQTETPSNDYS